MKNKILFSFAVILLFSFTTSFAQNERGISKYGGLFLSIPQEARQVGMGEAFTGLANDLSVMRYNVGGLGNLKKIMLSLNYHDWIQDTQQGGIGFVWPGPLGVIATNIVYFNEGSVVEMDENFHPTGFSLESNDLLLDMGYGLPVSILGQVVGLGASVKFIRQNLTGETATAFGLDLGAQYIYKDFISLGATIQDIGITSLQFAQQKDKLPMTYRTGVGIMLHQYQKTKKNFDLNLATDAAFTHNQKLRFYTGAEFVIYDNKSHKLISVRGGYKIHNTDASRWSAGFGIHIPMDRFFRTSMRLDYAYSPMTFLNDDVHRFSLVFKFLDQPTREVGGQKAFAVDTGEFDAMNKRLQEQLRKAEEATKAAQEAELRTRALEDSLRARLQRIMKIAGESEGKIEVEPKSEAGDKILITMRINFDFDKANIREDEFETMKQVAKILKTYPDASVFLSGHTDWIGPEEYNIRLSQRRVDSVMVYLVNKESVPKSYFFWPVGYGELYPVEDNSTAEGRFRNRRVEFLLFTADAKPDIPLASGIRSIEAVDESTIIIVANGKVRYIPEIMDSPDRLVIDFPNIYLLMDETTIPINKGPFIRARLGFHPEERFTRIVFDLTRPIDFSIEDLNNFVTIKVK